MYRGIWCCIGVYGDVWGCMVMCRDVWRYIDCKAYSQIRDIFFSKLETKIPDFKSISNDTLIFLLMNSSDYLINCQ